MAVVAWDIPRGSAEHLIAVHGEPARIWIEGTQRRLQEVAAAQPCRPSDRPLRQGYSAVVLPAVLDDGREIVIKMIPPWLNAQGEIAAMTAWSAEGDAPGVVWTNPSEGILVLEREEPGTSLAGSPGAGDYAAVAGIVSRLNRDPGRDGWRIFATLESTVERRAARCLRQRREENDRYLPLFFGTLDRIMAVIRSTPETDAVLLHGDAHPSNFLLSHRGILAIDPEPVIGHRAYDRANYAVVHDDGRRVAAAISAMAEGPKDEEMMWTFAAFVAATEMLNADDELAVRLADIVEEGIGSHESDGQLVGYRIARWHTVARQASSPA